MGKEDLMVRLRSLLSENVQSRKVGPKGGLGTQAMGRSRMADIGGIVVCMELRILSSSP